MNNRLAKLVFIAKGQTIKKIAIEKGKNTIVKIGNGRGNPVDVAIDSPYISRLHCEIYCSDNILYIVDKESSNGTFLNMVKLIANEPTVIKIGDIVTFSNNPETQLIISEGDTLTEEKNVISSATGKTIKEILHLKNQLVLGRNPEADIRFSFKTVSRNHATIKAVGSQYELYDTSSNGTYVNEKLINGKILISENDVVRIGNSSFCINDTYQFVNEEPLFGNKKPTESKISLREKLKEKKGKIILGRNKDADVVLNDAQVSRNHTEISTVNGKFWVRDLGSTNGTFLNGKSVKGKVEFNEKDVIQIGLFSFKLNEELNPEKVWLETAIRAENIEKTYHNATEPALKQMSVNIPRKAFIALMGPSGCGKTTLMNALNNANPATNGKVYIHGLELSSNFGLLKRKIGYVPQDDIVHKELSVEKSLYYAAKLRLPEDFNEEEIQKRISEVLESLNINTPEIRKNKVKSLSGGQRKRVSIAVELLNRPTILFLDEPTSPLDPETIDEFLTSIKKLAENGTTIVMVTHKPEDLNYVDRVIFLGTKGYHSFYGDKQELIKYFNAKDIIEVYSLLGPKNAANAQKYYNVWYRNRQVETLKESPSQIQKDKKESPFKQYFWLTRRYLNIKTNDRINTFILLAQAPIIAILTSLIFKNIILAVPFMMAISAIWFGASNAAREIVGELPIFRRERMFNLKIIPYILSKLSVLTLFSAIQAILFIGIIYIRYNEIEYDPEYYPNGLISWENPALSFLWMMLISFTSTLLGLLLSSVVDTTEKVMTLIPIVLIPQIMLAGIMAKIENEPIEYMSYITISRWGTEGFCIAQDSICASVPVIPEIIPPENVSMQQDTTNQQNMQQQTENIDTVNTENEEITEENQEETESKVEEETKMKTQKVDALFNKDYGLIAMFHEDYRKGNIFPKSWVATLALDALALFLIALGFFAAIFTALTRKNSV